MCPFDMATSRYVSTMSFEGIRSRLLSYFITGISWLYVACLQVLPCAIKDVFHPFLILVLSLLNHCFIILYLVIQKNSLPKLSGQFRVCFQVVVITVLVLYCWLWGLSGRNNQTKCVIWQNLKLLLSKSWQGFFLTFCFIYRQYNQHWQQPPKNNQDITMT